VTLFGAHLETSWPRRLRWSAAALVVVAAHAGIAIALSTASDKESEGNPAGIMEVDLAALAVEAPFEQPDSEKPDSEIAAPPPQPPTEAPETEEQPQPQAAPEPEPQPTEEAQPTETPPPEPETAEDVPKLEEAPLAPEPEVALPKQEEKREEPPPEPKPPVKAEDKPVEKKKVAKPSRAPAAKAASAFQAKFDPNPIYRAKPVYPASARSSKIEGYVVVRYSVSASGAVTNVSVVSASPAGIFNSATIAAVKQWRFKPPGQQVSGRQTTIRFKLR